MIEVGKKKKGRNGFTLIEILMVIAIIGILASIVLVSLSTARTKAQDAKKIIEIEQIRNLLEIYYMDKGYYPSESEYTCDSGGGWSELTSALVSGGYTSSIPQDSSYFYCGDKTSDSQEYVLGTSLQSNSSASNFKGIFFTHWSGDDVDCTVSNVYCVAHCQNVPGQEGPNDISAYPPNCGTY